MPCPRALCPLALLLMPVSGALIAKSYAADPPAAPTLPRADPLGAFAKDRNFNMVRLELDAELDPVAHTIAGGAAWTVQRLGPGPLRLDAVGFYDVRVTIDGAPATVIPGRNELTIPIAESAEDYKSGATRTVVVHYKASPQLGLHWRGPTKSGGGPDSPDAYAEVYSQGEGEDNRYWFPSYDHPDDRFEYSGRFTIAGAPKGWTVVTNSGPDLPSYLVMVAAGPYDNVQGPIRSGPNAVDLRALVPRGTPDSWIRPVLDPLPDMLDWFTQRTGVPYPWGSYTQTFVQRFIYTGMENTASTIMADRLLAPTSVQATRSWVPLVVAHELAHQWYGDLLTARTAREMWLNEGFATFFAADWEVHDRRLREGEDAADAFAAAQIDGWRRGSLDTGSLAGRWALGGGGATHAGVALGEANHNVYSKGAMVLTMLRVYLGEETFWAAIRDYTSQHAHSSVDTIDLQRAMEYRSGKDLGWFFQQWTELPSVPKVTTSWTWTSEEGGRVFVELQVMNANYTLPVDISVDGGPANRAWLKGDSLTVTLPAANPPAFVAIDPNGGLLVDWEQQQSHAAWVAELAGGSPYSRLLALHALAEMPVDPIHDPLAAIASGVGPSLPGGLAGATPSLVPEPLRVAAIRALGTRRTCGPLLPLLEDADERLRSAAANAIGHCPDRSLVTPLIRALGAESNSDIRGALVRSVTAIDPAVALPIARRELARADALDPERVAAADTLGVNGTVGDIPALLRVPASRDVRLAGLRSAVKILQRQELGPKRDALRGTIARSAERLLMDLDLRGIQGAIGVLRDVGDGQSAALLDALSRSTTLPDLARSARDAVPLIGARVDTVAPVTPNETDARLKALEDRLKDLEAESDRK